MIYYTKYAEEKFAILNKHKVYFTKERVEEAVLRPEKIRKKGKYLSASREKLKVVYTKRAGNLKIITFYPIK